MEPSLATRVHYAPCRIVKLFRRLVFCLLSGIHAHHGTVVVGRVSYKALRGRPAGLLHHGLKLIGIRLLLCTPRRLPHVCLAHACFAFACLCTLFLPKVGTALEQLLEVEARKCEGVYGPDSQCVGLARLGQPTQQIVAGTMR